MAAPGFTLKDLSRVEEENEHSLASLLESSLRISSGFACNKTVSLQNSEIN